LKRFNFTVNCLFLPILAGLLLFFHPPAIASTQKIAILPFEIHSQGDLSYIGAGAHQMLTSRLAWKDHVLVTGSHELNTKTSDSMKNVARAMDVDYVLSGSITEIDGAFSLDATVFNSRSNSIETFFSQAETMDDIIPKLDILAAKINHKLFDRKTAALETMEPVTPGEPIPDIRANPETLMPKEREADFNSTQDRPFWKIWGSNKPSIDKGEDRPFWKFWGKNAPDDGFDDDNNIEPDKIEKEGNSETIKDVINSDEESMEKEEKPFWKFW